MRSEDTGLPRTESGEDDIPVSPRTLVDLQDAWHEIKKGKEVRNNEEETKKEQLNNEKLKFGRGRSMVWRDTVDMLRREPPERRKLMRQVDESRRRSSIDGEQISPRSQIRLLVTMLWSSVGINSEDIVPLLSYVCTGLSAKDLQKVVEERLGPNPSGKLHYSKFADTVLELAKSGVHFQKNAIYTNREWRFIYFIGTIPRSMRKRVRKRVQFLAALFLAVDKDRIGTVSILDLHAGLVSIGEYITVEDLFDALVQTGETDLNNLEKCNFGLFLRLIGYIDGRSDRRLAAKLATRTLTAPITIKTLSQLVRLFIFLDTEKTGYVSCLRLPEKIIYATRFSGMDVRYLFRLACEIANSYMRDSDFYDFPELIECAMEFSRHFRLGASAKRRDWIALAANDDFLKPPGSIQWAALIDKLPINNKARIQDYQTALATLSDRHLRRTTRDGSNIFHHLAHFGDDVACKLTLSRDKLKSLVVQRNRAGIHPAALAIVRQNFDCAAILRPWIEYILDNQAYGKKQQRLLEIRKRQLDLSGKTNQVAHAAGDDAPTTKGLNVLRPWVEPGGASLDKIAWKAHR